MTAYDLQKSFSLTIKLKVQPWVNDDVSTVAVCMYLQLQTTNNFTKQHLLECAREALGHSFHLTT